MKKLLQILAKKQHYLYDDLITVKPSISSTTNTVTVKYRKIHKNILPQFHPLRPSILSQMKRNKETKGCKDWIICREKLLFSRCHLNRKDLQIYGNRLGVSYIFEGRISRVVLADAIFHSPFLHSTATPEVRGSLLRARRRQREERPAAGNGGEALSIFRFLCYVYSCRRRNTYTVPFFCLPINR